jgi:hypothetical protein
MASGPPTTRLGLGRAEGHFPGRPLHICSPDSDRARVQVKTAPAVPLARRQRRAQPPKARAAHAEPQSRDSPDQQG